MTPDEVRRAAAIIAQGRLAGVALDDLPADLVPRTTHAAYLVQAELHRLLAPTLGPRGGWKIGCTTPVMQAYLGIDTPSAGALYARTIHHAQASLPTGPNRLGVECELAVRLGRDLPGPAPVTRDEAGDAVAAIMAAIEIVEDRFVDYTRLAAGTLIADDFFGAGCVLGPEVTEWRGLDLGAVSASMAINGVLVGSGSGRDILGDPLLALAWLATNGLALGEPLRAGQIVLLGSLVQTNWVVEGDTVVIHNEPLGEARVTFT